MWWWLRPWIATREQGISVRPPTRLFATKPALDWPRRSAWRNAGRGRRCDSRNSRDPGGNLFFQMEGAEGWRCYQHLGLSGINWHKLYSLVRIRSGWRLAPEVVGFAGFRGQADRRRGRVDRSPSNGQICSAACLKRREVMTFLRPRCLEVLCRV